MPRVPQPAAERRLTEAERAEEARRMAKPRLLGAVRHDRRPVCSAFAYGPCQVTPPADHLARWIAAYRRGTITRVDLAAVVGRLVVITDRELIEERAA